MSNEGKWAESYASLLKSFRPLHPQFDSYNFKMRFLAYCYFHFTPILQTRIFGLHHSIICLVLLFALLQLAANRQRNQSLQGPTSLMVRHFFLFSLQTKVGKRSAG